MPAYFDTGFSVRQPMWHGGGNVLEDYPTDWNDARKKAGLEWEPAIKPIYALDDRALTCVGCNEPLNAQHDADCVKRSDETPYVGPLDLDPYALQKGITEDPAHRLVVRDDTHAILGTVSDKFSLVYHRVMGQILEAILGQTNVKFETAGASKGGALVWALAYLDEPFTVAGDDSETFPFVALLNSHDGSGACKLVNTDVRVVCWNTYQAASMQGERTGRQFTFRHAGDVEARIDEAVQALSGVRADANEWNELATELYALPLNDEDKTVAAFMHDFPGLASPREHGKPTSERVEANVERARTVFKRLYFDSVTTEAHRGTALGLVDAAVEYLDHVRGFRDRDSYLGRTMLRPEPLKARAVSLVRQLVSA